MANFQIGGFAFLAWSGEVTTAQEAIEVLRRPGVNGVLLRMGGKSASPFQVTTMVDVGTEFAARNLVGSYASLKSAGAQDLVVDSVSYTSLTQKLKVQVLQVELVQIKGVRCCVGGLNVANGADGFLLTCQWLLQPVEI